eukprot:scaffold190983_cov30-Tisochrysis_lutea.AAC.1
MAGQHVNELLTLLSCFGKDLRHILAIWICQPVVVAAAGVAVAHHTERDEISKRRGPMGGLATGRCTPGTRKGGKKQLSEGASERERGQREG